MSEKLCPFCGNVLEYNQFQHFGEPVFSCTGCSMLIDAKQVDRRTPGPATKAMIERFEKMLTERHCAALFSDYEMRAFIAEWKGPPDA